MKSSIKVKRPPQVVYDSLSSNIHNVFTPMTVCLLVCKLAPHAAAKLPNGAVSCAATAQSCSTLRAEQSSQVQSWLIASLTARF